MIHLTAVQLDLLRRCDGGLRVWEGGADLSALQERLQTLRGLKLVAFDEDHGYQLTALGEAWLARRSS